MDNKPSIRHRLLSTNKKIKLVAGIVLLAVLVLFLYNYQSQKTAHQRSANIKPDVEVFQVARQDMFKKIVLTGKTVPESQVDVAAKYTGKITLVNVELGQKVIPGQLLIVQDVSDVQAALLQSEATLRGADADAVESSASFQASYQKAKSDYQLSLTNYQRYKTLYASGAVSKLELDNVEQTMLAAKSSLDALANQFVAGSAAAVMSKQAARDKAQGAIYALQNQQNDLAIRAPRAGVIGFRQAEVGNMAQAGQKLLTIVDNSKIYVDCLVAEQDIGQIVLGMPGTVAVESLGKSYGGKIIYVSPAMDAATQSYTVRLELVKIDESLKAGMFARTEITMQLRPKTLFVPKEAVISLNGTEHVFIIGGDNKAVERKVKTGLSNDKYIEIVSGINEGERVAVSNLSRLQSGSLVNPAVVSQ